MSWINEALDCLAASQCGYHAGQPRAAEPTALAALAFAGAGRIDDARTALRWLGEKQTSDGHLPPLASVNNPGWPTPQALLASVAVSDASKADSNDSSHFDLAKAQKWLLSAAGLGAPQVPEMGHNTRLIGWPWVLGTHSWQEPTAWSVLALRTVGLNDHPRTREGVRLLVDRLISTGGCNYGNTIVFGQTLRPHVEPTGITLVALAGEQIDDPRLERSLKYLDGALTAETTPISLSYGLLGLAAHNRTPADAGSWLEAAYRNTVRRDAAPFVMALLVLASQGKNCPLIKFTQMQKAA